MAEKGKPISTIVDFVTGETVPDIGAEANRQAVERILVNTRWDMKRRKRPAQSLHSVKIRVPGNTY